MRIMNGLIFNFFQKPITLYVSYRTIQWLEELRMLLNNHHLYCFLKQKFNNTIHVIAFMH